MQEPHQEQQEAAAGAQDATPFGGPTNPEAGEFDQHEQPGADDGAQAACDAAEVPPTSDDSGEQSATTAADSDTPTPLADEGTEASREPDEVQGYDYDGKVNFLVEQIADEARLLHPNDERAAAKHQARCFKAIIRACTKKLETL